MNTLNRYILKKFIGPFLTAVAFLVILIIVSQVFERLDRFLADGVTLKHVVGYLLTSTPFQVFQFLPVATFMAVILVVGKLARTKEYIAGLAGGIPPEKFLGGLLISGALISFAALLANETFIPRVTEYSRIVYKEKIRRLAQWRQTIFPNLFVAGAEGRIWSAKLFNLDTGKMERVIIDTYTSGSIGEQIDATTAESTKDGWAFSDGVIRTYGPDGLTIVKTEPFEKMDRSFKEKPNDLATQEPRAEHMTYQTLRRHIDRLSSLGVPTRKLQVELMMKLAFPFSCFVVTLLGIPLALRGKGNWGWGIAIALGLTLTYMAFLEFGAALAQRLIPPFIGAWLANFIFLSLGLYLWHKMRKTA